MRRAILVLIGRVKAGLRQGDAVDRQLPGVIGVGPSGPVAGRQAGEGPHPAVSGVQGQFPLRLCPGVRHRLRGGVARGAGGAVQARHHFNLVGCVRSIPGLHHIQAGGGHIAEGVALISAPLLADQHEVRAGALHHPVIRGGGRSGGLVSAVGMIEGEPGPDGVPGAVLTGGTGGRAVRRPVQGDCSQVRPAVVPVSVLEDQGDRRARRDLPLRDPGLLGFHLDRPGAQGVGDADRVRVVRVIGTMEIRSVLFQDIGRVDGAVLAPLPVRLELPGPVHAAGQAGDGGAGRVLPVFAGHDDHQVPAAAGVAVSIDLCVLPEVRSPLGLSLDDKGGLPVLIGAVRCRAGLVSVAAVPRPGLGHRQALDVQHIGGDVAGRREVRPVHEPGLLHGIAALLADADGLRCAVAGHAGLHHPVGQGGRLAAAEPDRPGQVFHRAAPGPLLADAAGELGRECLRVEHLVEAAAQVGPEVVDRLIGGHPVSGPVDPHLHFK